jgi:hypothetical protein
MLTRSPSEQQMAPVAETRPIQSTWPGLAQEARRTVLVAVINNAEDLRRAASEGWYRIPQRRAPRRIGADYLAFYQTGAFREQDEAATVTWYAATRRYRLLTRRELIPAERAITITVSSWGRFSGWSGPSRRVPSAA